MSVRASAVVTVDAPTTKKGKAPRLPAPPLWLFAALAVGLLLYSSPLPSQDINGYHCYAVAFWSGRQAAAALPAGTCLVPLSSLSAVPFHTLPVEYGPLAMLTFLPPLLAPSGQYGMAFIVEMTVVVVGIAYLLQRYGAPWAGHLWLIYALLGNLVEVAARFDVVASGCVLVALIALRRGRAPWAYLALAAGTLLKYYPVVLLPLMLIESWRMRGREPLWRGPAIFAGVVAAGEGIAALLNPRGWLSPVTFMSARCVQVESLPATAAYWLARVTGAGVDISYSYAYNTECEYTASLSHISTLALVLALGGLAYTIWLFWRGHVSLTVAAMVSLALIILGSKVFSPQYVLWVSPLIALEFGSSALIMVVWAMICLFTTLCFPMAYTGQTQSLVGLQFDLGIPLTAGIRNMLMAAAAVTMMWRAARGPALAGEARV